MNVQLLILKFHPIANWLLKGIPRGVYPIYQRWKKGNPEATERDLAVALFSRRFSVKPWLTPKQEQARIKSYFDTQPEPENLVDMCIASAMVEFQVPLENRKAYTFIKETISTELFKLGYRLENSRVYNGNG